MADVIVVIGPGSIGQAIARRVSAGKHVLLAGLRPENVNAAASLAAVKGVSDAVMSEPWTMKMGGHVIFTLPTGGCLRKWVLSHIPTTGGILSAYLRMDGVPHDSIYESDRTE